MILDAVLLRDRPLLLPRVAGRALEFAAVGDLSQLRRSQWGVLEPGDDCAAVALAPEDLVLIPGLAFDRCGRRLGRGGGYYDRAFSTPGAQPFRVGIGFSFQLVASVPVGRLDRRVDGIATETGFVLASAEPRDRANDPG